MKRKCAFEYLYIKIKNVQIFGVELIFIFFYLWCAITMTFPRTLVSGALIDILSFSAPLLMIFVYSSVCLFCIFIAVKQKTPYRQAMCVLNAMLMVYVAIEVYIKTGLNVGLGLFFILGLCSIFTLWRLTVNEGIAR